MEKFDCILIQETKMSNQSFSKLAYYLWPWATYAHSKVEGASRGLAILWNPNILIGIFLHKEKYLYDYGV